MKAPAIPFSSSLLALAITASGSALAPQTASDTGKAFDAKVSQADGTRWRPAIWHCRRPPRRTSAAAHVSIAPALNPDFTQKLDQLKTLSGEEFDRG
jgi:hypothetical protein